MHPSDADAVAVLVQRLEKSEDCLVEERARATALDHRLQQLLHNAQYGEENARRAQQLARQLEEEGRRRGVAEANLAQERGVSGALQRELHSLADASQVHLKEFSTLSNTLHTMSMVRLPTASLTADATAGSHPVFIMQLVWHQTNPPLADCLVLHCSTCAAV
jgi:hypothetical protein